MKTLKTLSTVMQFNNRPASQREVVIYSEGRVYWPYFESLIEALVNHHQQPVTYVTSDPSDPGLNIPLPPDRFQTAMIGAGYLRTWWFQTVRCNLFLMTMPDLNRSYLKRSPGIQSCLYLFHAPTSLHLYHLQAFDAYDGFLCTSPHQVEEIRQLEAHLNQPSRAICEQGYTWLDRITPQVTPSEPYLRKGPLKCLIAPTWGKYALIHQSLEDFIEILQNHSVEVTVRPHPQSWLSELPRIQALRKKTGVPFETFWDASFVLNASDYLLTDISGIMVDAVFGYQKPCLFWDIPIQFKPTHIGHWLHSPMWETTIRPQLGPCFQTPHDIVAPPWPTHKDLAHYISQHATHWQTLRNTSLFNPGEAGLAGAAFIQHWLTKNR